MSREMHAYFFEGEPSRAKRLDSVLNAVSAGRWSARAIMYLAAAVVAIAAAWGEAKGWITGWFGR